MIKKIAILLIFVMQGACTSSKDHWAPKTITPIEDYSEQQEREVLEVESVDDARNKARNAIAENDIDMAQAYYVKAYGMEPDNIALLQEMSVLYKIIKRDDLVELCYQLILKKHPDHYQTLRQYGLLQIRLNQYPQAEDKLTRVLGTEAGKKDWRIYNGLGLIKDLQGLHGQAIAYFLQALELSPKQIDVLNNIAYSFYREKKYIQAKNYYKQALAIEPKNSKVLFNYALLKARTRQYDSAVTIFSRIMTPAKANNDTGYIAMKNGDYAEAEYYLHKARELSASFYKKAYDNQQTLKALQHK